MSFSYGFLTIAEFFWKVLKKLKCKIYNAFQPNNQPTTRVEKPTILKTTKNSVSSTRFWSFNDDVCSLWAGDDILRRSRPLEPFYLHIPRNIKHFSMFYELFRQIPTIFTLFWQEIIVVQIHRGHSNIDAQVLIVINCAFNCVFNCDELFWCIQN